MQQLLRVVFLALALLSCQTLAQLGRCEPYGGGVELCNQFYKPGESMVYFGPGALTSDQASAVALVQPQAQQLGGLRILFPQCFFVAAHFLCTSYFPNCTAIPINSTTSIPIGRAPCRSACENTNSVCASAFAQAGKNLTNCTVSNPVTGGALFPENGTVVPLAPGVSFTVPCNPGVSAALAPPVPASLCRGPLIPFNGTCAISCPRPPYLRSEWHSMFVAAQIVAWVCVGAFLLFGLPLFFMHDFHHFPKIEVLWILIGVLMVNLGFTLYVFDTNNIICRTKVKTSYWPRGPCILQGLLIISGGLFSAAWALAGTINATYKLFANKTQEEVPRWTYWVYYVVCFGVPIAAAAVALGAQKVQSHVILMHCGYSGNDDPTRGPVETEWWEYGLFWIPFGVIVAANILLFPFAVAGTIYHRRRHDIQQEGWFGARVRSGLFLLYYFYVAAYLYGYRFSVKRDEDSIRRGTEDWVRCYYTRAGVGCSRTPPNRPSPAMNYVEMASLNGLMLVALLVFSTTPALPRFYKYLGRWFTGGFHKDDWHKAVGKPAPGKEIPGASVAPSPVAEHPPVAATATSA